jgi:hypothetical protein
MPVDLEGVALDDAHRGQAISESRDEAPVFLDRYDSTRPLRQRGGEPAEARTDLHDSVRRCRFESIRNAGEYARILQEVLTEGFLGARRHVSNNVMSEQ